MGVIEKTLRNAGANAQPRKAVERRPDDGDGGEQHEALVGVRAVPQRGSTRDADREANQARQVPEGQHRCEIRELSPRHEAQQGQEAHPHHAAGQHDSRDAEPTMKGRAPRRDQTGLGEGQHEPGRKHHPVQVDVRGECRQP
jgi:hypothetical protein